MAGSASDLISNIKSDINLFLNHAKYTYALPEEKIKPLSDECELIQKWLDQLLKGEKIVELEAAALREMAMAKLRKLKEDLASEDKDGLLNSSFDDIRECWTQAAHEILVAEYRQKLAQGVQITDRKSVAESTRDRVVAAAEQVSQQVQMAADSISHESHDRAPVVPPNTPSDHDIDAANISASPLTADQMLEYEMPTHDEQLPKAPPTTPVKNQKVLQDEITPEMQFERADEGESPSPGRVNLASAAAIEEEEEKVVVAAAAAVRSVPNHNDEYIDDFYLQQEEDLSPEIEHEQQMTAAVAQRIAPHESRPSVNLSQEDNRKLVEESRQRFNNLSKLSRQAWEWQRDLMQLTAAEVKKVGNKSKEGRALIRISAKIKQEAHAFNEERKVFIKALNNAIGAQERRVAKNKQLEAEKVTPLAQELSMFERFLQDTLMQEIPQSEGVQQLKEKAEESEYLQALIKGHEDKLEVIRAALLQTSQQSNMTEETGKNDLPLVVVTQYSEEQVARLKAIIDEMIATAEGGAETQKTAVELQRLSDALPALSQTDADLAMNKLIRDRALHHMNQAGDQAGMVMRGLTEFKAIVHDGGLQQVPAQQIQAQQIQAQQLGSRPDVIDRGLAEKSHQSLKGKSQRVASQAVAFNDLIDSNELARERSLQGNTQQDQRLEEIGQRYDARLSRAREFEAAASDRGLSTEQQGRVTAVKTAMELIELLQTDLQQAHDETDILLGRLQVLQSNPYFQLKLSQDPALQEAFERDFVHIDRIMDDFESQSQGTMGAMLTLASDSSLHATMFNEPLIVANFDANCRRKLDALHQHIAEVMYEYTAYPNEVAKMQAQTHELSKQVTSAIEDANRAVEECDDILKQEFWNQKDDGVFGDLRDGKEIKAQYKGKYTAQREQLVAERDRLLANPLVTALVEGKPSAEHYPEMETISLDFVQLQAMTRQNEPLMQDFDHVKNHFEAKLRVDENVAVRSLVELYAEKEEPALSHFGLEDTPRGGWFKNEYGDIPAGYEAQLLEAIETKGSELWNGLIDLNGEIEDINREVLAEEASMQKEIKLASVRNLEAKKQTMEQSLKVVNHLHELVATQALGQGNLIRTPGEEKELVELRFKPGMESDDDAVQELKSRTKNLLWHGVAARVFSLEDAPLHYALSFSHHPYTLNEAGLHESRLYKGTSCIRALCNELKRDRKPEHGLKLGQDVGMQVRATSVGDRGRYDQEYMVLITAGKALENTKSTALALAKEGENLDHLIELRNAINALNVEINSLDTEEGDREQIAGKVKSQLVEIEKLKAKVRFEQSSLAHSKIAHPLYNKRFLWFASEAEEAVTEAEAVMKNNLSQLQGVQDNLLNSFARKFGADHVEALKPVEIVKLASISDVKDRLLDKCNRLGGDLPYSMEECLRDKSTKAQKYRMVVEALACLNGEKERITSENVDRTYGCRNFDQIRLLSDSIQGRLDKSSPMTSKEVSNMFRTILYAESTTYKSLERLKKAKAANPDYKSTWFGRLFGYKSTTETLVDEVEIQLQAQRGSLNSLLEQVKSREPALFKRYIEKYHLPLQQEALAKRGETTQEMLQESRAGMGAFMRSMVEDNEARERQNIMRADRNEIAPGLKTMIEEGEALHRQDREQEIMQEMTGPLVQQYALMGEQSQEQAKLSQDEREAREQLAQDMRSEEEAQRPNASTSRPSTPKR